MNIRLRLTLQFLFTVALLLLGVLGINYFFAVKYADDSFYERLAVRSEIYLENYLANEFGIKLKKAKSTSFRSALNKEEFIIFNHNNVPVMQTEDAEALAEILDKVEEFWTKREWYQKSKKQYFSALVFETSSGKFLVIGRAVDEVGSLKLQNQLLVMLISVVFSLLLIYLIGLYFAQKALQPIGRVVNEVNQITASSLSMRVHEGNGKDEIAKLAQTFNKMLERLEESFELQSNFVSNASHELRNPIASIIGNADVALDKERTVQEYRVTLRSIFIEAERLKEIIDNLLSLTQSAGNFGGKGNFTSVRIDELLMDLVEELALKKENNRVLFTFGEIEINSMCINGNPTLLTMAFSNLIDNACKYSDDKPVYVRIDTTLDTITIEIRDEGIGISAEDQRFMFQPFYRSNKARSYKGFGIGLTIAKKVLDLHDAALKIDSKEGIGTTCSVSFKTINDE
jgi:signal transduction histidine kinase